MVHKKLSGIIMRKCSLFHLYIGNFCHILISPLNLVFSILTDVTFCVNVLKALFTLSYIYPVIKINFTWIQVLKAHDSDEANNEVFSIMSTEILQLNHRKTTCEYHDHV